MKRIFTLFFIVVGLSSIAQDTTTFRAFATSYGGNTNFFTSDSMQMTQRALVASPGNYGHAIFMNNTDSLLYLVQNLESPGGNRDIFLLDPFSGVTTLYHDLATSHVKSADIDEEGNAIYMHVGNGGTSPGDIVRLDLSDMSETVLGNIPLGMGPNTTAGLEFHPADSSLYLWMSDNTTYELHRFDLATNTYTTSPLSFTGASDYGFTGGHWTGVDSVFIVVSGWSSYFYNTDNTSEVLTNYAAAGDHHDITVAWTLRREADNINLCPGDSTLISLIYNPASWTWYRDGVALAESNDSIWVNDTEAGDYWAVMEINGTNYMRSEIITVNAATVPVVTITQSESDSLICPGDTITLTGASGGTLQWYMDGTMIAGATSNTYDATATGSYNQMKTNMSGCSDTAAVAYVIYDDPNCGASIEEDVFSIDIYPNPVQNTLNIQSTSTIKSISIVDLSGRKVARFDNVAATSKQIDFEEMTSGIYLVKVKTEQGELTRKIVK